MKKDQNKRLLGAMEFIDDKLIDRAAEKIKERPVGAPAEKPSKKKAFRQLALLAACLLLLGAAVPLAVRLVNYIPNMLNPAGAGEGTESDVIENNETEPPVIDATPEEYFTNGWLFCSTQDGEYDGKWIHVSSLLSSDIQFLAAYDPVTKSTKSICLDSACDHLTADCPAVIPIGWFFRYMMIIDDWCVYQIDGNGQHDTEIRMYNMKTGDARVVAEDTTNGNIITYPSVAFVMDGKVYLDMFDIDDTAGTRINYISCYDPETDKTERMLDVPENLLMLNLSNKRIFFVEKPYSIYGPSVIWSSDYSGGNLKKEEVPNFDFMLLSGTYAYEPLMKYSYDNGYNLRVYDLATDTMHEADLGGMVECMFIAEGKIFYVPEGSGKLYVADELGRNPELAVEFDSTVFNPGHLVGDYIIGRLKTEPRDRAALNIKTGEITPIPGLTYP